MYIDHFAIFQPLKDNPRSEHHDFSNGRMSVILAKCLECSDPKTSAVTMKKINVGSVAIGHFATSPLQR